MVENGGEDVFAMVGDRAAEKFLECIRTYPEDRGLLQSAGYGLGAIAKRSTNFTQLPQTLTIFKAVLDESDCRTDEDKAESTDNIIGALGKCVLFQQCGVGAVREWLSLLPLHTDSEEAQAVHKLLFEEVIKGNRALAEAGEAEVAGCIKRIVRVAEDKKELELLDDEGKEKAQLIISRL